MNNVHKIKEGWIAVSNIEPSVFIATCGFHLSGVPQWVMSEDESKEVVAVEFEMIDKDEFGIILTKPIHKITKSEQYPDGLLTVTKIHYK